MLIDIKTGETESVISASMMSVLNGPGMQIQHNGKTARLAIIDENNQIIEAGDVVSREAFKVAIKCYDLFLIANGHIKVFNKPENSMEKAA